MNRKGFTLIELLAVILITSLVLGLTTYGIISAVNSAKENSATLSLKSVKESARTYSSENSTDRWKDGASNNTYFCVTVEELINKGLLDKKAKDIEDGGSLVNFIAVIKDKTTKVIKKELLLKEKPVDGDSDEYSEAYSLCTGDVKTEEIVTSTQLKNTESYTDTITTEFEDAIFKKDNEEINIIERYCYYGKNTSNITNSGNTKIEGNTCIIDSLKQEEDYYVKVCVKSESNAISCTNPKSVTTVSITKPTININGENNIKVIYSDDNIYKKDEASYYFKSTMDGTSNKNVSTCTLDNNMYTCNSDNTISIVKDTWYKTSDKEIILTYQDTGNIKVTAETRDKSNNSKSSEKEFSLYKITFNKGNADSINNQTSNIEKMCLADKNSSCKITSPTIAKEGYNIIGWNTNSSATSSSWNVNVEKDISKSDTYYPILKIKTFGLILNKSTGVSKIYYKVSTASNYSSISSTKIITNVNYGTTYDYYGVSTTGYTMTSCTFSNPCSVTITNDITKTLSANINTYTITFNGNGGSGSMSNINATYGKSYTLTSNSFTKSGYKFNGWNTKSDGSGTNYSNEASVKNLTATNKGIVTLYAQWSVNTYTILYNANGGSGAPSYQTKEYNVSLTLSSTKPTRTGYTFISWNTNSNGTGTSYNPGDKYNNNNNLTLYAQWRRNIVTIEFSTNGGELTSTSISNGYSADANGIITKNGSKLVKLYYDDTISSSGLPNYNNSGYLNITRNDYIAIDNAEWSCLSNNCKNNTYDHDINTYKSSDFCDASINNCTVTLGVNWERYKEINDYRCYSENANYYFITYCRGENCYYIKEKCSYKEGTLVWNKVKYCSEESINAVRCNNGTNYYITTCTGGMCNYTQKNGSSETGKIDRCTLNTDCIKTKTMYINTCAGLNCRYGAGSGFDIKVTFGFNTAIEVNTTPTNGWYYNVNANCYLSENYLQSSKSNKSCSSDDNSSSTGDGYLSKCTCNKDSDCGVAGSKIKLWCSSLSSGKTEANGKYMCAWQNKNNDKWSSTNYCW